MASATRLLNSSQNRIRTTRCRHADVNWTSGAVYTAAEGAALLTKIEAAEAAEAARLADLRDTEDLPLVFLDVEIQGACPCSHDLSQVRLRCVPLGSGAHEQGPTVRRGLERLSCCNNIMTLGCWLRDTRLRLLISQQLDLYVSAEQCLLSGQLVIV